MTLRAAANAHLAFWSQPIKSIQLRWVSTPTLLNVHLSSNSKYWQWFFPNFNLHIFSFSTHFLYFLNLICSGNFFMNSINSNQRLFYPCWNYQNWVNIQSSTLLLRNQQKLYSCCFRLKGTKVESHIPGKPCVACSLAACVFKSAAHGIFGCVRGRMHGALRRALSRMREREYHLCRRNNHNDTVRCRPPPRAWRRGRKNVKESSVVWKEFGVCVMKALDLRVVAMP